MDDLKKMIPMGEATSRSTLLKAGIKSYTLDNYLRSGKLKLLTKGVYCWKESLPNWQGLVASLPRLTEQKILVGGITALELQGYSHYLKVGADQHIHLYSGSHVPPWVKSLFISLQSVNVIWHSTGHLWSEEDLADKGVLIRDEQNYKYPVSIPERAILELLFLLPDHFSFEHTNEVFQGLTQLSPHKMSAILMMCKSIKVKRLFFWFADKYNYPWRKHINENEYTLGAGKRVIASGGILDKRYNITVPSSMQEDL
jgi:hypothetical protein